MWTEFEAPEMAVPIKNSFLPPPSCVLLSGEVCERVVTMATSSYLAYRLSSVHDLDRDLSLLERRANVRHPQSVIAVKDLQLEDLQGERIFSLRSSA